MTKQVTQRAKKNPSLQKTGFLIPDTCRYFHRQVANLTSALLFIHFNAKQQIKLEADASSYTIFEILSSKQNSK